MTKQTPTPRSEWEIISELSNLNRQLTALIDDPNPGMFAWRGMLSECLQEITALAQEAGLVAGPEDR